jgi:hypothetical protein
MKFLWSEKREERDAVEIHHRLFQAFQEDEHTLSRFVNEQGFQDRMHKCIRRASGGEASTRSYRLQNFAVIDLKRFFIVIRL